MKKADPKKKKSTGVLYIVKRLLIIATALALGLFMPTVVTGIQNRRADSTREYVDLGSSVLSLTSDSAKLEKLGLVRTISYMPTISNGKYMTAEDAIDMMYEISRLIENTGLPYTQFGRENIESAEPQLLISDETDVTIAILWIVNASIQNEDGWYQLNYAVDDATGLIVAAEYYQTETEEYYQIGAAEETFTDKNPSIETDYSDAVRRIASNITEMYKFTNTTADLDNSVSVGDYYCYNISFYTDGQRVLTVPVYVEENEWSINTI